jgi:hypothetical protein
MFFLPESAVSALPWGPVLLHQMVINFSGQIANLSGKGALMHALSLRSARRGALAAILLAFPFSFLHAADVLTWQQKEAFLAKAKIIKTKEAKKGVTGTFQVTLSDGTVTHDASVQTIDDSKQFFLNEIGFKDTYRFNIAAWKLARLLGIEDMVPPSVKRNYQAKNASFTWWIDNVQMDEEQRRAKNVTPPDENAWNEENNVMNVFDQLIYNMDRNQTNMIIDQDWHLWMIDHSRAFRVHKSLKDPGALTMIDRNMLAKLKLLDEPTLTKEFGRNVNKNEVRGLLARRDLIVKFFEAKGESALFDRPHRN